MSSVTTTQVSRDDAKIMFRADVLRGTNDKLLSDVLDSIAQAARVKTSTLITYLKGFNYLDDSCDNITDKACAKHRGYFYHSVYAIQTDCTYDEYLFSVVTPAGVDFLIRKAKASIFMRDRGYQV